MLISYSRIGANMRKARLSAGLTQQAVAERIGISLLHYGRMERGQRKPSLDALARVAQALDVRLSDLMADCTHEREIKSDVKDGYTESLMRLVESSPEKLRRAMYSVCWLIAADLGE